MDRINLKTKIRRLKYRIKHNFLTLNNVVLVVAFLIAISWAWGSIEAMQKNYALQQELEIKQRDKLVAEIQYKTLTYEQKYLQSEEYKEVAAREKLGLASSGEHMLILPKTYNNNESIEITTSSSKAEESNFRQWANFLFGGNTQK